MDSTSNLFIVILFIRVFYHRHRARRRIEWRTYKKMTAQLLPISALYLILQLPPMIRSKVGQTPAAALTVQY